MLEGLVELIKLRVDNEKIVNNEYLYELWISRIFELNWLILPKKRPKTAFYTMPPTLPGGNRPQPTFILVEKSLPKTISYIFNQ